MSISEQVVDLKVQSYEAQKFLKRCTKPDKKEYLQISRAVVIGFAIMGVIGFLVKLIHIPINNILVA